VTVLETVADRPFFNAGTGTFTRVLPPLDNSTRVLDVRALADESPTRSRACGRIRTLFSVRSSRRSVSPP
jgi:hypothetical protein